MWRAFEYELAGAFRGPWPSDREAEEEFERILGGVDLEGESEDSLFEKECTTAPAVTPGEFGTALRAFANRYCLPDKISQFLKFSPTFMAMAKKLDQTYLYLDGAKLRSFAPSGAWYFKGEVRGGVLTAGAHRGRRVLDITNGFSSFVPADSPGNRFAPYDTINIEVPMEYWPRRKGEPRRVGTLDEIGRFIEVIAHETTHAFTSVTRTKPSPARMADRVREAIAEEGATRRNEARVVREIKAGVPSFRPFKAQHECDGAGCTKLKDGGDQAWVIERNFFPSKHTRTYLEHFVLSERSAEAMRREGLKPADVVKIEDKVERVPLERRPLDSYLNPFIATFYDPDANSFQPFKSEYFKFRLWLRVLDARWFEFLLRHPPGAHDFEAAKERVLQEHARTTFGAKGIRYTPLPSPTP